MRHLKMISKLCLKCRLVDFLPLNNRGKTPTAIRTVDPNRISPNWAIIPDNPNTPYDMEELIEKLADEGDFYEIQGEFAKNIITGLFAWKVNSWCCFKSTNGVSWMSGY